MPERILGLSKAVTVAERSLRITLVEDAAEYLQVKKGDKVAFILAEDGRVYVRKA
jgi:propanediol utilization protein